MSIEARLKEELTTLRLLLGVFIGGDASLIAWVAQYYRQAEPAAVVFAVVEAILLTVGCLRYLAKIHHLSEKLEIY